MAFELPPLPYAADALQPHISKQTLEFHHGKHHATYVKTLNELIKGTPQERMPLETLIMKAAKDKDQVLVFNNAGQHWNHSFFWTCLKPHGGGKPGGDVAAALDTSFGGVDKFKEEFKKAATTQFGSGWAWLVLDQGKLKITKTANADLPMAHGQKALLTCDVWEHAYYLDYQNRRPDFVQAFLDHLVNWDAVAQHLAERAAA
jgi:Fe-Mn family superoxide dismutase